MSNLTVTETLGVMTVPELRGLARQLSIAGRSRMRKAELVAQLAAHPLCELQLWLQAANREDGIPPEGQGAAAVSRETAPSSGQAEAFASAPLDVVAEPTELDRAKARVADDTRDSYPDMTDEEAIRHARDVISLDSSGPGWVQFENSGDAALDEAYRLVLAADEAELFGPAEPLASQARPQSGYTDCACGECFDITVSRDMRHPELCSLCAEAGCTGDPGDCCERPENGFIG